MWHGLCNQSYPLVNVYITMENHHFQGKSTINDHFQELFWHNQRVDFGLLRSDTKGIDSLIPRKILQTNPILNHYVTTFKSTRWRPEGSSDFFFFFAREVQGHRCFWNMISDGMSGDTRRKGPSTTSKKCTQQSVFWWKKIQLICCSQIVPVPNISHSPEVK